MLRFTAVAVFAALACFSSRADAQAIYYSNTTNFTGQGFANGGGGLIGSNTITRLVADDINFGGTAVPYTILGFQFSVANFNTTTVNARPRVRFYNDDGTGSGPGTLIAGFSFAPITFAAGPTVQVFNATGVNFTVDGSFWAGITFDDSNGTTGATLAQLNNLGQGIFNPPTVGSSTDIFFQTTANGDFFLSNPTGGFFNFGGNPVANFGWQFTIQSVPEPSALMLIGAVVPAFWLRRRRASVN